MIKRIGVFGYGYYDRGLATGFAVGGEKNITPFSDDKDTVDNQVAILDLEDGVMAMVTCLGIDEARETGTVVDLGAYGKDLA